MKTKNDSPGVHIPPPLIYVLTFFAATFLQRRLHLDESFFSTRASIIAGIFFLVSAIGLLAASLARFIRTRNTVVLIKPATSLQTTGVYAISRNPMYLGLLFVYIGVACLIGNWWNFILMPVLILIVEVYVIRSEEKYLYRAFGEDFIQYKKRVRRWL